jgi:serine protease Do
MNQDSSLPAVWRRAAAGVLAGGLLAGCTFPGLPGATTKLTSDQVFARAKPALVLVQVDYSAKISLPRLQVGDAALSTIRRKLQAQYDSGLHPELLNHDAYLAAFDVELYGNPDAYFTPSKDVATFSGDVLEVNGSGFIASENGFIATSAHVVATKDEEIQKEINSDVLKGLNTGLATDALTDSKRTDEQKQKFAAFYQKYTTKYLKVESQTKEIHVALAKGTPGKPLRANGIPARIVEAGEPVPGKDVAVLKIDPGPSKLPSLSVGDENMLRPADDITAIGYPGESIFRNQDTDPRQVEPTQTHGEYQKVTEPQQGYDALGTRANIQEGESGGPMVDGRGDVVGVIAFGIADKDGKLIPNLGFAVPASVVKEYLDKAKAGAGQSQTEAQYRAALTEFDQKHFKTALPLFREVKSRWKDHPYVDAYIVSSENGIADKADRTPPSQGELAAWGVGGALGLLVLAFVVWFVLQRRRAHRRLGVALEAVQAGAIAAPAAAGPALAEAVGIGSPVMAPARSIPTRPRRPRPRPAATETAVLTKAVAAKATPAKRAVASAKTAPVKPVPAKKAVAAAKAAVKAAPEAAPARTAPARKQGPIKKAAPRQSVTIKTPPTSRSQAASKKVAVPRGDVKAAARKPAAAKAVAPPRPRASKPKAPAAAARRRSAGR